MLRPLWCKRGNSQGCPLSRTQRSAHKHTLTHGCTQTKRREPWSPSESLDAVFSLLVAGDSLSTTSPSPPTAHIQTRITATEQAPETKHRVSFGYHEFRGREILPSDKGGCRHFLHFFFFFRAKEEAPFQSKSFPVRISTALHSALAPAST